MERSEATAPRPATVADHITPSEYVRRHSLHLVQFYALATTAMRKLPQIVSAAGALQVLDAAPTCADPVAKVLVEDEMPGECVYVSIADFCSRYALDAETILRRAVRSALPRPRKLKSAGHEVAASAADVALWSLGGQAHLEGA